LTLIEWMEGKAGASAILPGAPADAICARGGKQELLARRRELPDI